MVSIYKSSETNWNKWMSQEFINNQFHISNAKLAITFALYSYALSISKRDNVSFQLI